VLGIIGSVEVLGSALGAGFLGRHGAASA
jgi:hypothetical protein